MLLDWVDMSVGGVWVDMSLDGSWMDVHVGIGNCVKVLLLKQLAVGVGVGAVESRASVVM